MQALRPGDDIFLKSYDYIVEERFIPLANKQVHGHGVMLMVIRTLRHNCISPVCSNDFVADGVQFSNSTSN